MTITVNRSLSSGATDDLSPVGRLIALGPPNNDSRNKWGKICSVRFAQHLQGQFTYLKVFIGFGNNGSSGQNAFFDLFGQLGWTGDNGGRAGWTAVLHPCNSNFTKDNIALKIIANTNKDYDIWFKAGTNYCVSNVMFFPSVGWRYGNVYPQTTCTVYDVAWTSTEPSGTESQIVILSESKDS